MTKANEFVSVVMPTRNRRRLLERAVSSVLEQTWGPPEIIIVDDASEDDTPVYLKNLTEHFSNVQIIRNKTSQGAAVSRNVAIQQARCQFITFLDDDDYWKPDRLERLIQAFDEEAAGVCSYDEMKTESSSRVWKKSSVIRLDDLLFYNMVGNQVLTRTEYIRQLGGFDEQLPSAQDYDLWIRLAEQFGPIVCVPEPLLVVNAEENRNRISTAGNKMKGYRMCFRKHEHLMTDAQTRYQKYRLKLAGKEPVSWLEMLRSVPPNLYVKEIMRKLFL